MAEFTEAAARSFFSPVKLKSLPRTRRAGEGVDRGEIFEEAFVVGDYGCDLSLLQHGLGDPDGVRIAAATPGKVAAIFIIPEEQLAANGRKILLGHQ